MATPSQVGLLVAVLLTITMATAQDYEDPPCFIPEGHTDKEPVGYYDPEPRSG